MNWKITRKDAKGVTAFGSNISTKEYADEIAKKYQGYAGAGVEFIVEREEEKKNEK
jgi:hypothetical protein